MIICVLSSCVKDYYTEYKGVLYNKTTHKIIILPFIDGTVYKSDTIYLNQNDSFILAEGTFPGIVENPGFVSNKFRGPIDSSYVIFDDSFIMVHYIVFLPDSFDYNYYLYDNPRNIWNSKQNYKFIRIKLGKHHYLNLHEYVFTEQDYLDAKN